MHPPRLSCFVRQACLLTAICVSMARWTAAASPEADQYWPQWRGPLATGALPTAHPPTEWSEQKNIKWKAKLPGSGTATPIIWGDKIFIQTAIPTGKKIEPPAVANADAPAADTPAAAPPASAPPSGKSDPPSGDQAGTKGADAKGPDAKGPDAKGPGGNRPGGPGGRPGRGFGPNVAKPDEVHQFVLLCLDRKTGDELWQKVAREEVPHEGHHPDHGYASYSPVTDGQCVIAYFGSRGLYCYDMEGNLKWEKDLGKMKTVFGFGEGSSPALFGNTVVVNWDHEGDDFIVAFNKETGDELWRTPRDEKTLGHAHCGALRTADPGHRAGHHENLRLRSDRRKSDLGMQRAEAQCRFPAPCAGRSRVRHDGFSRQRMLAIAGRHTGDLTGTESIAWSLNKDTPYVPFAFVVRRPAVLQESEYRRVHLPGRKTGELVYGPDRLEGLDNMYASPLAAAANVFGRAATARRW